MQSIGLVFKKNELIAVALNQGARGTYLEGYQIIPVLGTEEAHKEEAVLHSLDRFLKAHKQARDNLFIALPRSQVHIQFLKLPATVEENLQATLGYEIDRYTPLPRDDIYFDYHIVQRLPEKNILNVLLIIIKKQIIDDHLNLFAKIHVRPRGIEVTTTALYNLFEHMQTPHQRLAELPWLKAALPVLERYQAQLAKVMPGLAGLFSAQAAPGPRGATALLIEYLHDNSYEIAMVYDHVLCHSRLCESRATSLPEHLQEIYASAARTAIHLPADQGSALHMRLSGKEMSREYVEHLSEQLRPFFDDMGTFPFLCKKPDTAAPPHVLPLLSVPLGAALKGLKDQTLDINLIPPQRRPRKKRSKKKMIAAAVLLLIMALAGTAIGRSILKMKAHVAILDEQLHELKQQVQSIEDLQKEAEKIEQFAGALKTVRAANISKIGVLAEMTRLIPADSWLTDFDYVADNNQVRISGFAVSASQLILLLEESKLFANVKFTSPITMDKLEKKEKFRIEMNVAAEEAKP